MTVLVIATHPDDEVLGCGGVMARHTAQGDSVQVLVVTRGTLDLFPEAVVEETRKELKKAHALLGVAGVTFLDFEAPKLDVVAGHEVADAVRNVILDVDPSIVYLPHRGDLHSDHKVVFWATLVACRPANRTRVQKLLCYETLSETDWGAPFVEDAFVPNVYVNIEAHLKQKICAMQCYQSQLKPDPHPRSVLSIEALARLRGATAGLNAAEAFVLIREVVD